MPKNDHPKRNEAALAFVRDCYVRRSTMLDVVATVAVTDDMPLSDVFYAALCFEHVDNMSGPLRWFTLVAEPKAFHTPHSRALAFNVLAPFHAAGYVIELLDGGSVSVCDVILDPKSTLIHVIRTYMEALARGIRGVQQAHPYLGRTLSSDLAT